MGAVHGVYLKYVGLSALSYGGYVALTNAGGGCAENGDGGGFNCPPGTVYRRAAGLIPATVLAYSAVLNGSIAVLFQLRAGMGMLGKRKEDGRIPIWSYVVFFPFHLPTALYTYIHTKLGTYIEPATDGSPPKKVPVPVASEVLPGWWIGGRYAHLLNKQFAGIVDLTVEFPELCQADMYLLVPVWDGVPPTPEQLEEAATFSAEARRGGDVLIHCAHGRGRSTTVMCAALVRAGLCKTWQEAFEEVRPGRPVVKLNGKMRAALTAWQRDYVDGKKGQ